MPSGESVVQQKLPSKGDAKVTSMTFSCPRCGRSIERNNESIVCGTCGVVGKWGDDVLSVSAPFASKLFLQDHMSTAPIGNVQLLNTASSENEQPRGSGLGPIFIIGMGRSGTTLLRSMLHNHPRIAIPYETHFIGRYAERADEFGDLELEANRRRLVDDILSEPMIKMWDYVPRAEQILARTGVWTMAGVVDAVFRVYAESKRKVRWGDKSDNTDCLPAINDLFPDAQFIHIIRDGRDVARSVIKLPWGPNDIIEAASWWNDYVWVARRMGAILGKERYIEVRYEDLVADPVTELQRLCRFLRELYAPEMLEYHSHAEGLVPEARKSQHYNIDAPPLKSRAYAWKREMSTTDAKLFSRYAHRMLRELGYEIPYEDVSNFRVYIRMIYLFGRRILTRPSA